MARPARAMRDPGVRAALASAALFGIAAPLAQRLLDGQSPWMLAALLYLGAGIGLVGYRRLTRAPAARLPRADQPWFAAAIAAGGIAAPVLLLAGLSAMPAASASLLLTTEGAFTAGIAWLVLGENVDRRVLLGFAAILSGVVVLAWPSGPVAVGLWPSLAVLGACLLWAIDNNLTRRVSLNDATWLAAVKGCVAGSANLVLALLVGGALPSLPVAVASGVLGFLSYGVSLVLFVVALRHLGTARTGAYFSVAPFVGACLAVLMGDRLTWQLVLAGVLMAVGIWLHLTERHVHEHAHAAVVHRHPLLADDHHAPHGEGGEHTHSPVTHSHEHYPDAHHRHGHGPARPEPDVGPPS